jgi:tetratricopeptide (TPR) repeat protein
MYRTLSAILIVVIFGPLEAQQPSPPSQPAPVSVQVSEGPGAAFQFTKVDNNLRAEADAVDAQYEKRGLVLHDPDLQAYIDSTGSRILGNRPIPEKVTYRFLVLRDPMVNAFALPNGSVYITTGLLALLEDEAQLAGILGHETAHIYERHPYLENRSIRKKTVASEIIAAAAACVPGGYGAWLATAAAANVSTLILVESIYGYSREMESQADHDGLAAMTVAGYDPHAMAADFELLDQDRTLEYEPRPTFYHDHPNLRKRREEALAFADTHTPASLRTVLKKDYIAAVAPAIVSNINTDIESRRPRTAVARATRLVDAFPGVPQYKVLLGDSYRELGAKTTVPTPDELTPEGEDRQRKKVLKMSEQEEQKALLNTPESQATLKENRAKAEKAFLAAIESDPQYALAYRELGFLYQDESRFADAALNYRHYLQLVADTSLDRLRIGRRLAEVEKPQAALPH